MKVLKDKKLYAFLTVVLIFFGVFVKMNFSVDTYLLLASKNFGYTAEYVKSGRIFTALLFKSLSLLRFNYNMMYVASFVLGIVFLTLSIYTLDDILKKYIKNDFLRGITSICIVVNPFIIELWLFIEMGIMMLSIYASILAFKHFDEYLEGKNNKELLKTMAFMLIALFSYQGTVAIFISLTILTIFIHSNDLKSFIKNTIVSFLCYGIPTLINFIVVMVIGNSRVGVEHDYIKTFEFIIMATGERLVTGFGMFPIGIYLLVHIFILLICLIAIIAMKKLAKEKMVTLLKVVYLLFMTYFFTILVVVPQDSNGAAMFPRNMYAFASIVGLVCALIAIFYNNETNEKLFDKLKMMMICIMISFLTIEFGSFTKIAINRYAVNAVDRYVILEIKDLIEEYESQTGYKIKNVALYNVENSTKFLNGAKDMINVSARSEKLSSVASLVFYTGCEARLTEEDEYIYETYFEDKTWTAFDDDQIVFEGDTLHWYLY